MSLLSWAVRFVAAAVVWCSLLAAAVAVTLGGVLGVHPGPYEGGALVLACLLLAALASYVVVTGVPTRAADA